MATTNYPAGYDTNAAQSLNASKVNKEDVTNAAQDVDADELSVNAGATLALEYQLGDGSSVLTRNGDADENNVREIMDFMCARGDRADSFEHFTGLAADGAGERYVEINSGGAHNQVDGMCGVWGITSVAATIEGLHSTYNHHHQRYSFFRGVWRVTALPVNNATDYFKIGLYRDATHYVMYHSTRALGVWPGWTVEVNDGGATDSALLTAAPVATTNITMEILTTTAGAYFLYMRGTASEEYEYLSGQAPENGYAHPYIAFFSNAGGESIGIDMMGGRDTRTL